MKFLDIPVCVFFSAFCENAQHLSFSPKPQILILKEDTEAEKTERDGMELILIPITTLAIPVYAF